MAVAALYPLARFTPLGAQTQRRMMSHDIACLHTMVGYLTSTDRYFRISNGAGFRGTESHFGLGGPWGPDLGGKLDGAIWQWQDIAFSADANLDGWKNVISMETADNGGPQVKDIPPWSAKQCEALSQWLAWICSPGAHAKCPSSWTCHKTGIPLRLIANTKPGQRGVGYHAQGVPGNGLVSGGVAWSSSPGKECPTPQRIRQIPAIITRAVQITGGATTEEWNMATADQVLAEVKAARAEARVYYESSGDRWGQGITEARKAAADLKALILAEDVDDDATENGRSTLAGQRWSQTQDGVVALLGKLDELAAHVPPATEAK